MKNYKLEPALYFQTLWFIRRYDEFKAARAAAIGHTPERDGISGGGVSDPTFDEARRLLVIDANIQAIECALAMIPNDYRAGVWASVQHRQRYPDTANRKTWQKWRQRFVFYVARFKGWA